MKNQWSKPNIAQNDKRTPEDLLEDFRKLYSGYANTLRSATEPFRLENLIKGNPGYKYSPYDPLIRESLLEHVGVLPMVATTFYPYINEPEVDLGKALTMLAIHDIGELTTGDTNTFVKKADNKETEREAAFKLLDPSYHELYIEVESQGSVTAKFAKAIDKVAADILDYLTPVEITVKRFEHFVHAKPEEIVDIVIEKKRPYMQWNKFMNDFHILLVNKFSDELKRYLTTSS